MCTGEYFRSNVEEVKEEVEKEEEDYNLYLSFIALVFTT